MLLFIYFILNLVGIHLVTNFYNKQCIEGTHISIGKSKCINNVV